MKPEAYVLNFAAASRRGQVAQVITLLEQHHAYIEAFSVFDDTRGQYFYIRCVFHAAEEDSFSIAALTEQYQQLVRQQSGYGAIWPQAQPVPVLILVSKTDHCLNALISASRHGDLNMAIVGIASNHADLAPIAQAHQIPYFHLPVSDANRAEQEQALFELKQTLGAEYMVLARYMQVLSPDMCRRLAGSAINIHHSFLPGFRGAKPYEQAHARGVKLIGATAHFVTPDLDEGPIIEQAVERVDHAYSPEQLLSTGRHIESIVLERALRYVLERRVFINGERTVILR